ncbi:small acid-soluble spore protein P [Cohnella fermenti]|uniref:Small acid-soluble spore protein P n=1 Tax=Cohnella fermenti TaxID=2565925 RepID=A0A4S4BRS1_9BACL|nr:small acid-soluble spore protein P [Cohnella fermenti]THF77151.1 small acid-soluble spore protein P [Cohnella fermenti]
MSKPKVQSVGSGVPEGQGRRERSQGQPNEPLSGSKKVKNRNHVSHHNPQG